MFVKQSFEHIQEEIANMLAIGDEELDEEQRAAMDAYLDELASQEASKVDSFAQFIRLQTANADACKAESRRLAQKARAMENRIGWLKGKYLGIMERNNMRKVSGNAYTLSLRPSESVRVTDIEALEKLPEFVRVTTTVEPDKAKITESLKAGAHIPGCCLVSSNSLRIS